MNSYLLFLFRLSKMFPWLHTFKRNNAPDIFNFSQAYFKNKPKDCILYTKDNKEFEIHREILSQTEFTREILRNCKDYCCMKIEIMCPCTNKELEKIVQFLYSGEINCEDIFEFVSVLESLNKIFGFPKSLQLDNLKSLNSKLNEQSASIEKEVENLKENFGNQFIVPDVVFEDKVCIIKRNGLQATINSFLNLLRQD